MIQQHPYGWNNIHRGIFIPALYFALARTHMLFILYSK